MISVVVYIWSNGDERDTPEVEETQVISTVTQYTFAGPSFIPTPDDIEIPLVGLGGAARSGIYRVEELKAPNGFMLPSFGSAAEPHTLYFTLDINGNAVFCDKNAVPLTGADLARISKYVKFETTTSQGVNTLNLLVKDEPGNELPKSGGPGTTAFTVIGALICAAGAVGYGINARRRDSE